MPNETDVTNIWKTLANWRIENWDSQGYCLVGKIGDRGRHHTNISFPLTQIGKEYPYDCMDNLVLGEINPNYISNPEEAEQEKKFLTGIIQKFNQIAEEKRQAEMEKIPQPKRHETSRIPREDYDDWDTDKNWLRTIGHM